MAKQLLAETGYPNGITLTGRCQTDGGTHLTVTAQTATTGNAYQAVGTLFSTNSTSGVINSSDTDLEDMIENAAATYDDAVRIEKYGKIHNGGARTRSTVMLLSLEKRIGKEKGIWYNRDMKYANQG